MIRKRTSSFKPRLEALEDRWCPSAPGGGGTITNPALIFVESNRGTPSDLFLITANGSATQQITKDGSANIAKQSPAWSPDGTRIAFLRAQSSGGSVASGGLYAINADGTGLTLLYDFVSTGPGINADPGHIDWSPDGKKVTFAGWDATGLRVFILDVASGAVMAPQLPFSNVDKAYWPDWSPDLDPLTPGYQGKLAFTGLLDTTTCSDIYLLDVAIGLDGTVTTGSVTNLTNTPAISEGQPTWSPDGQWIAFNLVINGQSTLSKMRADGSGTQTLVSGVNTGSWSPDRQHLAYWTSRAIPSGATSELFRVRADGTGITNVTNTDRVNERMPDWNPKWINDLGSGLTAASTASEPVHQTLTQARISPILAEAIAWWATAGVDTSALSSVQVAITNLPCSELYEAVGNTIYLDANAAGCGWFIDSTPADDSEFTTPGNQGEMNHMDLLTVLEHELGHLLGYDHTDYGLMSPTLATGVRETPTAMIDQFFAGV